jgi:hypothetical protein
MTNELEEPLPCPMCGEEPRTEPVVCPFGFCPETEVCMTCLKEHDPGSKELHSASGCEAQALRYKSFRKKEKQILDSGGDLRISGELGSFDCVVVQFMDSDGEATYEAMPKLVYWSIPLDEPASLDDFLAVQATFQLVSEYVECKNESLPSGTPSPDQRG